MTEGAVAMRSRSNSRLRRSWMISRWSRPRKPQRKPKPSAAEVSISQVKLASLRRSLPIAARRSSNLAASTGKRPQNTTGWTSRKPGRASRCRLALVGDGVADGAVGDRLDRGGEEADFARPEFVDVDQLAGAEDADAVELVVRAGLHHLDLLLLLQRAIDDADDDDDAEIEIVVGVDQQRLERLVGIACLRRRQAGDDGFENGVDAEAGLGGNLERIGGVEADHVLDLLLHARRLRRPAGRPC